MPLQDAVNGPDCIDSKLHVLMDQLNSQAFGLATEAQTSHHKLPQVNCAIMILIHQNEKLLYIMCLQTKLAKICSHFRFLQSLNKLSHNECAAAVCVQAFKDPLCSDKIFPLIIKLLL